MRGKLIKIRPGDISMVVNRTGEHIKDVDIDRLEADIVENGLHEPVDAIRDGDKFIIFNGRRRTLAMLRMGWDEIPAWLWDIDTPGQMARMFNRS